MISKAKNVIYIAIILFLGTGLVWLSVSYITLSKKYVKVSEENKIILAQWNKIIRTPPRVTYLKIPVQVGSVTHYNPIPIIVEKDTAKVQTGTTNNAPCPEISYQWYDTTESIGDSVFVRWSANTWGHIEWLRIDSVKYPQYEKKIESFIPLPPAEIKPAEYKPKNHIGLYFGGFANNFKQFPNVQGGIFITFKDKWGLQPGGIYMPNMEPGKQWYGSINAFLYLK